MIYEINFLIHQTPIWFRVDYDHQPGNRSTPECESFSILSITNESGKEYDYDVVQRFYGERNLYDDIYEFFKHAQL